MEIFFSLYPANKKEENMKNSRSLLISFVSSIILLLLTPTGIGVGLWAIVLPTHHKHLSPLLYIVMCWLAVILLEIGGHYKILDQDVIPAMPHLGWKMRHLLLTVAFPIILGVIIW